MIADAGGPDRNRHLARAHGAHGAAAALHGSAPGPRGFDVARVLLALRRDPLRTFLDARARWGPVVRFPLGDRSFFLVTSHEDARRVLCDNAKSYSKDTWSYGLLRTVLGNGVFTSDGRAWRKKRRLVQPAFHRAMLATLAEIVIDRTDAMIARWQRQSAECHCGGKHGVGLDVGVEMTKLTLDIIARVILGVDIGDDVNVVSEHLTAILEHLDQRTRRLVDLPASWPSPRNERFRAHVRGLDDVVLRAIRTRKHQPEHPQGPTMRADLVSALLNARDEDGRPLDEDEIKDEVKTFLIAGHETTANLLTWSLGLLALHPGVSERVEREANDVIGSSSSSTLPTAAHVPRLIYTSMVLKETMRLYPPLWLVERRATSSDVLGGCDVPSGSSVAVCQYVLHRDPDFFPDPERWLPDRFATTTDDGSGGSHPPRSYAPFGAGPRMCMGDAFAMMEAQLVLARLAQTSLRLELVGKLPAPAAFITLRPATPIRMCIGASR